MVKLRLMAFAGTPADVLEPLRESLVTRIPLLFDLIGIDATAIEIPSQSFDRVRRQNVADHFLHALDNRCLEDEHILGVTDSDLYVVGLNFIFGIAEREGNALVALPRLRQSFYGLKDVDNLFFSRVTKECIHELGHVVGLDHCQRQCVMRFSNSIRETDRKPDTFCLDCSKSLENRG